MAEVDFGFTGRIKECFSGEVEKILSHALLIKCLERELESWKEKHEQACKANELLDADLGRTIISVCHAMLALARDSSFSRIEITYLLAAVSYVINQDDDSPDFESIIGFEDDAEVVARVIFKLNLANKIILRNPSAKEFFEHIAVKAIGGP
jgi:uncharacterized membrane protein YkvA (DUF1232 family)